MREVTADMLGAAGEAAAAAVEGVEAAAAPRGVAASPAELAWALPPGWPARSRCLAATLRGLTSRWEARVVG